MNGSDSIFRGGERTVKPTVKWAAGALLVLATLYLFAQLTHTPEGLAVSADARAFNRLKNRAEPPPAGDFDSRVTLAELLRPGEDRVRWSASRAAVLEGYVVAVRAGGVESANSFSLVRRDTHIEVGLSPDSPPRERVIVEVTPPLRDWAKARGMDWSHAALARELTGRRCRFEGWLLFDVNHAEESENVRPGAQTNWRATAWELHPVTAIKVLSD